MDDGTHSALWYFAFGSNLHRSIFLERRRMQPLATRWGWLEGYQLCFNIPVGPGERGVANIEAAAGARTCGALYLLTPDDFDRLDRTEGVPFGVYRRHPVDVISEQGDIVQAFAYQSSLIQPGRKPSPRYMRLLIEGAEQHGLPPGYLSFLRTFPLAIDEREQAGPVES